MGELYDVQPIPTHADYVHAAEECMRRQKERALLIIITNFRDEDVSESGEWFTPDSVTETVDDQARIVRRAKA